MTKQLLFTVFIIAVSIGSASAQSAAEQAVQNARDQFSNIKNRSIELERVKRDAVKRPERSDSAQKFPEIKEDFEQIQTINSDVLQPAIVKGLINYAAVLKAVSEINHRAVRLKSNLFAFESKEKNQDKNKKQIADNTQNIKVFFDALDESINSFAHNSIFQNINLVNPQDSLKAQADLETVIKISSAIKERAEKLAKGSSGK